MVEILGQGQKEDDFNLSIKRTIIFMAEIGQQSDIFEILKIYRSRKCLNAFQYYFLAVLGHVRFYHMTHQWIYYYLDVTLDFPLQLAKVTILPIYLLYPIPSPGKKTWCNLIFPCHNINVYFTSIDPPLQKTDYT